MEKYFLFYHLRLHVSQQISLVFLCLQNKMKAKTKQIYKSSVNTKVAKTQPKQRKSIKNVVYESDDEFFPKDGLSDKQQSLIQGRKNQQTTKKEKKEKEKAQNKKEKQSRNSFPANSRSKKSIPDGIIMFMVNKLGIFYAKNKTWIESKLYQALKEKKLNAKNRYILLCIVIKKIKSLNYLGKILEKRFSDIEKKKQLKLDRFSQKAQPETINVNFHEYIKQLELLKQIWRMFSTNHNENQILLKQIQDSTRKIFVHKSGNERTKKGIQAIQNSKINQISSLISQLKEFKICVKDDREDHYEEEINQQIVLSTNNIGKQLPIEEPQVLDNENTAHFDEQQSEDDQN